MVFDSFCMSEVTLKDNFVSVPQKKESFLKFLIRLIYLNKIYSHLVLKMEEQKSRIKKVEVNVSVGQDFLCWKKSRLVEKELDCLVQDSCEKNLSGETVRKDNLNIWHDWLVPNSKETVRDFTGDHKEVRCFYVICFHWHKEMIGNKESGS